jgi:hypothetical protein
MALSVINLSTSSLILCVLKDEDQEKNIYKLKVPSPPNQKKKASPSMAASYRSETKHPTGRGGRIKRG